MPAAHLCAGKIVWISLDAGNDLAEDDTVREHVCLVSSQSDLSFPQWSEERDAFPASPTFNSLRLGHITHIQFKSPTG